MNMNSGERDEKVRATLHSASLTAAEVPKRVLLAPWGGVESLNGSFMLDEEAGQMVVAAFEEHGTELPIDYEHQTLGGKYASPNGQAPAAGWIKKIEAIPGVGLVAEIEWTDNAREALVGKEYRYLSPVAIVRKQDRKMVALHSAALTNKPAIVGMKPIVNRDGASGEDELAPSLQRLRGALQMDEEVAADAVLVAASERIAELDDQQRQGRIDERIREAVASGRLVAAQQEWARALALKDEALFDSWLESAPVVVVPGRMSPPEGVESGNSRHAIEARARAEFASHPLLSALTSEQAYVAAAVREAG